MKYMKTEPETLSMTTERSDEPISASGSGSTHEPLSTALRRMHFKCGRILSSRLTTATSAASQSPIAIPKVILMGSSTTSETTLINNNTSTDSTGTMTTNFTTTTIEDSIDELTPIIRTSSSTGGGVKGASNSIANTNNNNNSQFNVFDIDDSSGSKSNKTVISSSSAATSAAITTPPTAHSSSTAQNNDFVRFLIDSKQNFLNVIDQITSGTSDSNNNRRTAASTTPVLSAAKKRSPFFRLTTLSSSSSSSASSSASPSPPPPQPQPPPSSVSAQSSSTANTRSRSPSPSKKREKIALLKRIDCLRDLFDLSGGAGDTIGSGSRNKQQRTKPNDSADSSGDGSGSSSKRPSLSSPSSWSAVSSRSAITPTAIHTPPIVQQQQQQPHPPNNLVDFDTIDRNSTNYMNEPNATENNGNYSIFDLLMSNGNEPVKNAAADTRNNNDSEEDDDEDTLTNRRRKKRRLARPIEYLSIPQHHRTRQCSLPLTATDTEFYRLRNFTVTSKGIVNRGDSFRSRRRCRSKASVASLSPTPSSSTEHLHERRSLHRNKAFGRGNDAESDSEYAKATVTTASYRVLMFGDRSVGKSSLVAQFQTSEYLHAYDSSSTDDDDDNDNNDDDRMNGNEDNDDDSNDNTDDSNDDNNFKDNGSNYRVTAADPDHEPDNDEHKKKSRTISTTNNCSSFVQKSISIQLNEHESNLVFINYFANDFESDWTQMISQFSSTFDPIHAFCLVFSIANRNSFHYVLKMLQNFRTNNFALARKAVILVGNKCDLVRSRTVSTEEGQMVAETYNCKYIETSITISHNVDELLVGLLTQIRLKETVRVRVPKNRRKRHLKQATAASKKNLNLNLPGGLNLNLNFSRLLIGGGGGGGATNEKLTRSQNQSPVLSPCHQQSMPPADSPAQNFNRPRHSPLSATASFVRVRNFFERVLNFEPKSKSCENLHVL